MKAMLLRATSSLAENPAPLVLADIPVPRPRGHEVLLRVLCCGVCHTELDEIEGRLPPARLPIVLGHQAVGLIEEAGPDCARRSAGERVGVAWIHWACGTCPACTSGRENLCAAFKATGRDVDGGYAEYLVADEAFVYPIPAELSDAEAAPLLCAGAIGYRSLSLARLQDGQSLGLTGFGASGHLVLKLARSLYPRSHLFVFARSQADRDFARALGAAWSGDTSDIPPQSLDAIIDTTPAWKPVVEALRRLAPGGRLVVNAIRKEERDKEALLGLDYPTQLWMEKEVKSVANVTRSDVTAFLEIAARERIIPELREYPLSAANEALVDLRSGKMRGAAVLRVSER